MRNIFCSVTASSKPGGWRVRGVGDTVPLNCLCAEHSHVLRAKERALNRLQPVATVRKCQPPLMSWEVVRGNGGATECGPDYQRHSAVGLSEFQPGKLLMVTAAFSCLSSSFLHSAF